MSLRLGATRTYMLVRVQPSVYICLRMSTDSLQRGCPRACVLVCNALARAGVSACLSQVSARSCGARVHTRTPLSCYFGKGRSAEEGALIVPLCRGSARFLRESPLPGSASVWMECAVLEALAAPVCALRPCVALGAAPCVARSRDRGRAACAGERMSGRVTRECLSFKVRRVCEVGRDRVSFVVNLWPAHRRSPIPAVGCHTLGIYQIEH